MPVGDFLAGQSELLLSIFGLLVLLPGIHCVFEHRKEGGGNVDVENGVLRVHGDDHGFFRVRQLVEIEVDVHAALLDDRLPLAGPQIIVVRIQQEGHGEVGFLIRAVDVKLQFAELDLDHGDTSLLAVVDQVDLQAVQNALQSHYARALVFALVFAVVDFFVQLGGLLPLHQL